jgi:L-alanine-DL-glutamate epimerase-like enolase superfamily enzyme
LRHPFRIALMTRTQTPVVFVRVEAGEWFGQGEASMPPYLGESHDTATRFLNQVIQQNILKNIQIESIDIQQIMLQIDALAVGNTAAKAAIDIALHDLKGKFSKQPVWKLKKVPIEKMPYTSCTIGIDKPAMLRQKVQEAADFSVLKIKLGSENDRKIIETIRTVTDKPLYVDANQGWNDKYFVLDMVHWLHEQGVQLVEQPFQKNRLDDSAWVTERSPLPILADESFQRSVDFQRVANAFHGVNIKLMKSTGLNEAEKMIAEARQRNLKIMIGCMTESSCAVMAAAQIAPFCDWADLDGPWLIQNNPFQTPLLQQGKIQLSNAAGLGLLN